METQTTTTCQWRGRASNHALRALAPGESSESSFFFGAGDGGTRPEGKPGGSVVVTFKRVTVTLPPLKIGLRT